MKLYHNGERGKEYNTVYKQCVEVESVEDLLRVVAFDHVGAKYQNGHRSTDDFLESDCLMLDVDNAPPRGQPDIPPSEWVDLEKIRADLPDVRFFVVPSKSHMKEKDGRPPRPKYHLYFPISTVKDSHMYKQLKLEITARLPYFDLNARDAARFFFGYPAQQAWLYEGSKLVTDWIRETPRPEQTEQPKPERKPPAQRKPGQDHQQTTQRLSTANADVTGNRERILSALDAIPCAELSRDEWIRIGMALNSLGWEDGLTIWDTWSGKDVARYKPGECERKWQGFKPGGALDHTYVIHVATQHGWTPTQTEQPERETMQDNKEVTADTKQEETAAEKVTPSSQVALALSAFETEKYKPLATGIKEIDDIINGGFFSQTLVLLGSHPGAGKTTLCAQLLEKVAASGNADVVYINLEMPTTQLLARAISRMTGIDQLTVMQGYRWTDSQRKKIHEAADKYNNTIAKHFEYMETENGDYENILEKLRDKEQKRENRNLPFILCLDYIQLLSSREAKDDVEIIKRSLKDFKNFAIERNAIVILIMAHSRSLNESGDAKQGAGRDSSAFEYSADLQLSLNFTAIIKGAARDKADMKSKISKQNLKYGWDNITLVCTKNRFGKSSEDRGVDMIIDGAHSRFKIAPRNESTAQAKAGKLF